VFRDYVDHEQFFTFCKTDVDSVYPDTEFGLHISCPLCNAEWVLTVSAGTLEVQAIRLLMHLGECLEEDGRWIKNQIAVRAGEFTDALAKVQAATKIAAENVRKFQIAHGLTPDGIAGPKTLRAMQEQRIAVRAAKTIKPGDVVYINDKGLATTQPSAHPVGIAISGAGNGGSLTVGIGRAGALSYGGSGGASVGGTGVASGGGGGGGAAAVRALATGGPVAPARATPKTWETNVSHMKDKHKKRKKAELLRYFYDIDMSDLSTVEVQGVVEQCIYWELMRENPAATVATFLRRIELLTGVNYVSRMSRDSRISADRNPASKPYDDGFPFLVPRVLAQIQFGPKPWKELCSDRCGRITISGSGCQMILDKWKVWE
jgi:hypothetical protein